MNGKSGNPPPMWIRTSIFGLWKMAVGVGEGFPTCVTHVAGLGMCRISRCQSLIGLSFVLQSCLPLSTSTGDASRSLGVRRAVASFVATTSAPRPTVAPNAARRRYPESVAVYNTDFAHSASGSRSGAVRVHPSLRIRMPSRGWPTMRAGRRNRRAATMEGREPKCVSCGYDLRNILHCCQNLVLPARRLVQVEALFHSTAPCTPPHSGQRSGVARRS